MTGENAADLEHALVSALAMDGPNVIHIGVDPAHYSETVYD